MQYLDFNKKLRSLALILSIAFCIFGMSGLLLADECDDVFIDRFEDGNTPEYCDPEPQPSNVCHDLPDSVTFTGLIPADRLVLVDPADTESVVYPGTETGLDQVIDAALAIGDPWDPETVDIDVTEVTVTNVGYSPGTVDPGNSVRVWVASGDGTMPTFLQSGNTVPEPTPGDVVSFKVTEVEHVFGQPRITAISGWTNHTTSGEESNDVLVRDSTGETLEVSRIEPATAGSYDSDLLWPHKIYGEITSQGVSCGGSQLCYDLTHGGLDGEVLQFRTWSDTVFQNDCIVVYGNLEEFTGTPQIQAAESGWFEVWNVSQ